MNRTHTIVLVVALPLALLPLVACGGENWGGPAAMPAATTPTGPTMPALTAAPPPQTPAPSASSPPAASSTTR